jgi:hypothetical protein
MVLPVAPVFDRVRLVPRPNDFLNRNVGASGELFYEKETKTLRVYNGIDRGGFEIVSQDRLRINAAKAEIATVKYNVTVGTDGSGNKYVFNGDGVYAPALSFTVGYTYVFEQSNFTNLYFPNAEGAAINQHPLNFSQTANGELGGGLTFLDGVVYLLEDLVVDKETYWNKFSRSTKRQVQITCTSTSPATLYYWCQNHTNMGSTITVGPPGAGSGASLEVSDTAPDNPSAGSIWYNSTSGFLYVYIEDADSSQWVQPVAGNVFSGAFTDLTATPTTLAGYGITDAALATAIPTSLTDLGISDGSSTQVLTTDGAGNFTFEDAAGGSSYDQSLNTTDSVTFANISSPTFLNSGTGVTNLTSASTMVLTATDSITLNGVKAPIFAGLVAGTGTLTVTGSGVSVASNGDNGLGDYTVTFSTPLGADTNSFGIIGNAQDQSGPAMVSFEKTSTTEIQVYVHDDAGSNIDADVFITIYEL